MPYWTVVCLLVIAGMGYAELAQTNPSRRSSRSINRKSNTSSSHLRSSSVRSLASASTPVAGNVLVKESSPSAPQTAQHPVKTVHLPKKIVEEPAEIVEEQEESEGGNDDTGASTFRDLSGSYVLNRFENFETMLIAMGAPWAGRKMILSQRPNKTLTMDKTKMHIFTDGLMPLDQEYVFGMDPIQVQAKKGFTTDHCEIVANGVVRLVKVNKDKGATITIDRELSSDGKELIMTTHVKFDKAGKDDVVVKHFFDRK